mgnify:CR=1 FL=1
MHGKKQLMCADQAASHLSFTPACFETHLVWCKLVLVGVGTFLSWGKGLIRGKTVVQAAAGRH